MSFLKKLFGRSDAKNPSNKTRDVLQQKEDKSDNQENESVGIFPRIKADYSHEIYREDGSKAFTGSPLPDGMNISEDQMPIVKKLYADLMLYFVVDRGNSYEVLQNEILKKNPDLNEDILHQISVNALVHEIGDNIKINGDPDHIVMVTADGNFEAAIILIEGFWEQFHQIINGNAIISIPARDLLFICKEGNNEAIEKLKEITKGYFDNPESAGLISKALYLKEKGKNELTIVETSF